MVINLFYFIFLIFFPQFSLCQREDVHDVIAWQARDNLYVVPIATMDEIITQNECPLEIATKCLLNSFTYTYCISNIYYERLSTNINKIVAKNTEAIFLDYLRNCAIKEINKSIKFQHTAISLYKHYSGGIFGSRYSPYPACLPIIRECIDDAPDKCVVRSQYNIFDKIINTCADAAFSKLSLTFTPSNPALTTYIDDIETQKINKIGLISDSYTSELPKAVIEIFGNLTYEEFEALKIISAKESILKQFLCGLNDGISLTFEDVKARIEFTEATQQIPENVYKIYKTFTSKIFEAVKAMLKVHPHLRWSFCSTIFAISPSKELTNIYSPPITKWALQNCRVLADNSSYYHRKICDRDGIYLFG